MLRVVQAARDRYLKVPGGSSSGSSMNGEAESRGQGSGGGVNKDHLAIRKASGSSSVMQAPLGRLMSIDEAAGCVATPP